MNRNQRSPFKWLGISLTVAFMVMILATPALALRFGEVTTAVIEGHTYKGVWRQVEGKNVFFPSPSNPYTGCGAPYCVYVAESNIDKIKTVNRDVTVLGRSAQEMKITAPKVNIQQTTKGSAKFKVIFESQQGEPLDDYGRRHIQSFITWTPLPGDENPGKKQDRTLKTYLEKGEIQELIPDQNDSFIRGPGEVAFDVRTIVDKFSPSSPLIGYAFYGDNYHKILGLGKKMDVKTLFEFYPPKIIQFGHTNSNADETYEFSNDNEIPFQYEIYLDDINGNKQIAKGTIEGNTTVTGTIQGPPSRKESVTRTIKIIFKDPRGKNDLTSTKSDTYDVILPSISLYKSVSYISTNNTRPAGTYYVPYNGCANGPDQQEVQRYERWYDASYTVTSKVKNNNNFPEKITASVDSNSETYDLDGKQETSGPSTSGRTSFTAKSVTITGKATSPKGETVTSLTIAGSWQIDPFLDKPLPVTCNPPPKK